MKIVKINKDSLLEGPYIEDANTEIEISDELYQKIIYTPFYHAWKYVDNDFVLIELVDPDMLRSKRQVECFRLVDNRSPMWYNHLTDIQKQEIDKWYQDWLDITDTKVIPVKPDWLK